MFMSLAHVEMFVKVAPCHLLFWVFAFQEAVRLHLYGSVSLPLLSDPLLPFPPECHPDTCVCAVSHGLLHTRYS